MLGAYILPRAKHLVLCHGVTQLVKRVFRYIATEKEDDQSLTMLLQCRLVDFREFTQVQEEVL